MARKKPQERYWARRLKFWPLFTLLAVAAFMAGRIWLSENPQHDPWAPLDLDHPRGWATSMKLGALRTDVPACRAVLDRSGVAFTALEPTGEGACRREDRLLLDDASLVPIGAQMTCTVGVGLEMWIEKDLRFLAREILDGELARLEQLGTYSCRRIGGGETGRWSQHAKGNAIDISAFVMEDGRRISLLQDWEGKGTQARFLRAARDAACRNFGTVLSPEYNAAHADHFHLDMGWAPGRGLCR